MNSHLSRTRHADCICMRGGKIKRANQHDTYDITRRTEVRTLIKAVWETWERHEASQSVWMFLCNIRHYLGKPERRWRPSTFWLMRYLRSPVLCSCSRDMWVRLGRASSNVVLKWGVSPLSSIVHTPLGPLMNTNSTEITNMLWLKYSLLSSVSVFLCHILKNRIFLDEK